MVYFRKLQLSIVVYKDSCLRGVFIYILGSCILGVYIDTAIYFLRRYCNNIKNIVKCRYLRVYTIN